MGYENAPACKIMATNCACCGKPLVDAQSVEVGMGPVCRKKYGYDTDVGEYERRAANVLIHKLAVAVSTGSVDLESLKCASVLRELGFEKIANIFLHRGAGVVIEEREVEGELRYVVRTPFSPEFNQASWMPGRFGVKFPAALSCSKRKVFHWLFPHTPAARKRIWAALLKCFSGALAIGPHGPFVVKKKVKSAPEPQTPPTPKSLGTCECGEPATQRWTYDGSNTPLCDECWCGWAEGTQAMMYEQ